MPGAGNRAPSYQRDIAELRREIRDLRRQLAARPPMPGAAGQMPFSWSGLVSGFKISGPWPTGLELTITNFVTDYTVTSSGDTDLTFYVNEVSVHTWSHPAATKTQIEPVRIVVPQGARCQLGVDGDDGEELTCFAGYYQKAVG